MILNFNLLYALHWGLFTENGRHCFCHKKLHKCIHLKLIIKQTAFEIKSQRQKETFRPSTIIKLLHYQISQIRNDLGQNSTTLERLTQTVIRMEGAIATMSHSDFKWPIGKCSMETMSHYFFKTWRQKMILYTPTRVKSHLNFLEGDWMSHTCKNPSRSLHRMAQKQEMIKALPRPNLSINSA